MQIRKCTEADIAATGAFYDNVVHWLDCHINYPKWVSRIYPSESLAREATLAGNQYICLEEKRITGAFVLNTDPQGAYQNGKWQRTLPDGTYMVLHAMAIAPDRQGKGLESEVIRFCVEKAKFNGFSALRLDAVPTNLPARKMYEKNGFSYAGDVDLARGIEDIPRFSLYELNW